MFTNREREGDGIAYAVVNQLWTRLFNKCRKKIHYTNTRLEIQLSPKEIKKLDYGVTGLE